MATIVTMTGFTPLAVRLLPARRSRRLVSAALAAGLLTAALLPGSPAAAVSVQHSAVVTDDPANWTPHALDGTVFGIVQAGNRVFMGGSFSRVRNANSSTQLSLRRLVAFNATTGAIDTSFNPTLDGTVTVLRAAPDGQSIYVGGSFRTVNGVASRGVVRLNASTGAIWPGWSPAVLNGNVSDLRVVGSRLIVGGTFSTVGGVTRRALTALSAATGAADSSINVTIAVPRVNTSGGTAPLKVTDLDVTPDGNRLVIIGNFSQVNGQTRHQLAVLNIGVSPATLSPWATTRYQPACSAKWVTTVQGLDISADGSWFVVVTSGGAHSGTLCDTAARWNFGTETSGKQPAWVNYTGGDTLLSVAITGAAVYVGGHQRWLDNPQGRDSAGPGAVSRPGIGAINPTTGKALSWNPTKERGHGTEVVYSTAAGLWIGSDTSTVHGETHGRIAFFPLP